jgi:tetratricopeptide (TPR) repeat protein
MISKEQLATVTEVLATASVVGVGLALGGPVGATVMAGIGINLGSNIIQSGSTHLKEKWISAKYGVLNHDIQRALARAFVKALIRLEARYFELPEANAQPTEKKNAIRGLFKELKDEAPTVFAASVEKIVSGQEVKEYLYGEPEAARARVWERVEGTKLLYTYYGDHFKEFLRDNINDELVFWFGEELKTDNRECNKAWRAFQRMLLEGIQAGVKAMKAGQEAIQQDLQKLSGIQQQLDKIQDVLDHRLTKEDEPFQGGLEKALDEMKAILRGIDTKLDGVASTTKRIEAEVHSGFAALGVKPEAEVPKVPDDIEKLFEEGNRLRDEGKYEEARAIFQQAVEAGSRHEHLLATAAARYYLSVILHEWDRNSDDAISLLRECVRDFKTVRSERHVARALHLLGEIELERGNLDEAEAYLSQNLELDKKNDDKRGIALTVHMLGWLEDHKGRFGKALDFYDQALSYWLGIHQEGDPKTIKEAIHSIAGEYQHKGLAHEHLGNIEGVEFNYMRALEWHRKSDFKPDVGKILFLLARLKYREAQYDDGTAFLDEAIELYTQTGDNSWRGRCLDLKGRMHFTLGQKEKATEIFELALADLEKAGDYKEQEACLNKLGRIHLESRKIDQAKDYFERARDLSLRNGLLESYSASVKNLAEIAHIKKDTDERNRLISEGIANLEKYLLSVQAEPERAFVIGQIGSFYEGMEDFEQALAYYQKARKAFESLSDIGGLANSLGSIARMKGLLGRLNEEFDTYRELKKILDGTPYYELIAGTAANLGVFQMRTGNLYEAKMLFQEAATLCRKYNLSHLSTVEKNLERLDEIEAGRKPPELSFRELIDELFEWVEWFPEAKDSILRLWMWARAEDVFGNYRNNRGVKLMVCQDDLGVFLTTSQIFRPYADLCLQVVSSKYPGSAVDVIPFPMDKQLFFDCAVPVMQGSGDVGTVKFLRGSISSRYALTGGTRVRSQLTGNEGVTITGWSPGLPPQAHELILSSSADELVNRKIFFLPGERYLAEDKLIPDLHHSTELGLVPVYFGSLPESENVEVVNSALIALPALSDEVAGQLRAHIRPVKRALVQLLAAPKNTMQAELNAFVFALEELADKTADARAIRIEVDVLEFPRGLEKDLQVAFVIRDHNLLRNV